MSVERSVATNRVRRIRRLVERVFFRGKTELIYGRLDNEGIAFLPSIGRYTHVKRTGQKKLESTGITTSRRQVGKVAAKKKSREKEEKEEKRVKKLRAPQTMMMISYSGSWLTWWL